MSRYIVLRHGPEIPVDLRVEKYEGLYFDALPSTVKVELAGPPDAMAYATDRFEPYIDGALAEVFEIRLLGDQ